MTVDSSTSRNRIFWGSLFGLLIGLGSACASSQHAESKSSSPKDETKKTETSSPEEQKVELDPVLFREGEEPVSAKEVFEQAYEAYSNEEYKTAVERYRFLIKHFEKSDYYASALYNLGLSYEKSQAWEEAARAYRRILRESSESEEAVDSSYRLAEVYRELGKHREIVDLMTKTLLRADLKNFDRLEAYLRRSNALQEIGNLKEARQGYQKLLELNRKANPDEMLEPETAMIVRAYLELGRTFHREMGQIKLKLPPETMGDKLDEKASLFKRAQRNYFDALRAHHPQWSVAAGYQIGQLYEDFYVDIFTAEIPEKLNRREVKLYFDELRTKIEPLMERAVKVYRKNLSLAKRIASEEKKNDWLRRTKQSLNRLEALLNNEALQRRAERLVIEGKSFDALWSPITTAVGIVDKAIQEADSVASNQPQAAM